MDKISCSIAKDLLPLYVDGVLSEDSCKVVKSHINSCTACMKNYEKMNYKSNIPDIRTPDKEKAIIKGIRKRINRRRVLGICVTAILVIAIALCTFFGLVHKQSYLPYADTGLYIENNELRTNNPYYCYYGFDSPEEGTIFIYMSTTFYDRHNSKNQKVTIVDDFSSQSDANNPQVKQVYYVSEEYVEALKDCSYFVSASNENDYIANNQEKLEKLKNSSTLIWSAE